MNSPSTNDPNLQNSLIEHEGIIQKIENRTVYVNITTKSACADCHAKGACSAFDTMDKIIEVEDADDGHLHVGQVVKVVIAKRSGFYALFLGYILPFIFLMVALITTHRITNNEGMAGIISLGILIPYYSGLFIFRKRIKKQFTFRIFS